MEAAVKLFQPIKIVAYRRVGRMMVEVRACGVRETLLLLLLGAGSRQRRAAQHRESIVVRIRVGRLVFTVYIRKDEFADVCYLHPTDAN